MKLNDKYYFIFDRLIRSVYPKHCPVCDEIIPLNRDYCKCSDFDNIKLSDDYCRHCGHDIKNCCCGGENSVYLPDVAAVYVYGGRIRSDILSFKFNYDKYLAKKLGAEMAERCAKAYCDVDFDYVTFVPMTKEAVKKRGYNQSQLLAEVVAEKFFIESKALLLKAADTAAQHSLSGKERINNLKNSIILNDNVQLKGKNILLCDDVKTTGTTLKSCVDVLIKAGASKVCCICVAVSDFNR